MRDRVCCDYRRPVGDEQIPRAAREHDEQRGYSRGERRQRRKLFRRWRLRWLLGLRLDGRADLKRIHPDRLGDVLQLRRAEIRDREIEPPLHLAIGVLGQADRARLANAFQTGRDIDAVAHQVAVRLLDDVAEMNADAEFDASLRRQAGVALDHAGLHFDRATDRVNDAAELDDAAIPGALDDAPVMRVDRGIDQIAPQPTEPRQGAIFVRSRQAGVADDVRYQDRCDFPRSRHGASSPIKQNITKFDRSRAPID